MAAPGNNMDVEVTFNQIITEKLCQEHLQGLKTFTTALRNDQFRWLFIYRLFFLDELKANGLFEHVF